MQMPPVMRAPSIMTSWPRRCDLDVSDCHVGTVDVFRPFPMPVMMRPTMKCPSENADVWSAAPTTMIAEPVKMVQRLPSMFPSQMQMTAPTKHPRLYEATEMPVSRC